MAVENTLKYLDNKWFIEKTVRNHKMDWLYFRKQVSLFLSYVNISVTAHSNILYITDISSDGINIF
jgi:hypothetical protein